MIKDPTNKYFDGLSKALKAKYKDITGSQIFKQTPAKFPCFYFKQLDGTTALQTLSQTEDGISVSYEIRLYSTVSAADVRKMANAAREYMIESGFNCIMFQPFENLIDGSVYQFIGRFRKIEV